MNFNKDKTPWCSIEEDQLNLRKVWGASWSFLLTLGTLREIRVIVITRLTCSEETTSILIPSMEEIIGWCPVTQFADIAPMTKQQTSKKPNTGSTMASTKRLPLQFTAHPASCTPTFSNLRGKGSSTKISSAVKDPATSSGAIWANWQSTIPRSQIKKLHSLKIFWTTKLNSPTR